MKITIQDNKTSVTVQPRDFKVTISGARGPAGPSEWGGIDGDIEDQTDLYNALQARVPYTGATADVNLGEYGAQLGNLEFDNTPTNVPTVAGSVYWNDTDGTLNMVLKGGQTISRIGETQHIRVLNNTGAQIARGKVVYVVGAQGQRLTIALADADTEILSKDTIGFTSEAIAAGAQGFVIVQGVINNISTTGMTDGATVYLSQTAGSYTTTPPADPAHLVILGFIVNGGSGGAGSIYVKVDNGYELEELHNVSNSAKTTPVADDALFLRDSADNNLWKRLTWTNALAGVKTHMDTFKSVAGGYASLDGSGKVPSNELPSYVDDVVEVANYAALPVTGETGKIYVTLDTNKCYRWSGTVYVQVAQGVDTLTTTGTSGAATLVGSTLNIPQYQSVLTNPVTGTGVAGQVSYWSGTGTQTGSADFTWNDTTKILSFSNGGTLINEIRVGSINSNTIIGRLAGSSASLSGGSNSFFGVSAGQNNTTGSNNSFFGVTSGQNNTTGIQNSFFGFRSGLSNTSGSSNVFVGFATAQFQTTGSNNVFFGRDAGRLIADGSNLTVASNSVFLGYDTRAAADSQTNQIVIGYQAIGLGSNTTVIGNSSTTLTWLGGNTSIGTTTSSARLHVRGSTTTSSTTALLVQNSAATELLKVLDNGAWNFNGDGIVKGSGNTSGTTALTVQNSDGTNMCRFNNNGRLLLGSDANAAYITPAGANGIGSISGLNTLFYTQVTAQNLGVGAFHFWGTTLDSTSGFNTQVSITRQFTPTSGTAQMYYLTINPTINQTGGANGITRGLYVNPTLTAAADWRSVEWSNNTGWGLYGAGTANNYLGGNTSIGTTTSSARLHVRGSGTTSSTTALLVQNSAATELLKVLDNGAVSIPLTLTVTGNIQSFSHGIFSGNVSSGGGIAATTGATYGVYASNSFQPTSGTATYAALSYVGAINQTGGANGITRGLYVNPTLTAAADWRSIETSNNTGYAAYFAGSADLFLGNGTDIQIGTTTGTKIGTATSQKIGLWNATPIVQPTTGVAAATRVGGGGTTVTDSDTFDGYTIAQLVKALRNMGALA